MGVQFYRKNVKFYLCNFIVTNAKYFCLHREKREEGPTKQELSKDLQYERDRCRMLEKQLKTERDRCKSLESQVSLIDFFTCTGGDHFMQDCKICLLLLS